jgi:hypothetical protein
MFYDKNFTYIFHLLHVATCPTSDLITLIFGDKYKFWGVKLTTHLCLVLSSRMCGAIPTLPQYTFMAWCSVKKCTGKTLTLPLPLISTSYKAPHYVVISFLLLFPLCPRSKYFQHFVCKHPQSVFFPYSENQVSHSYRTTCKIIVLYILICKFLVDRKI